jgi:transcriptional regulator with XRE-family HTH domain
MNLRERVARNLRRLRQEKSVSQEELAHLAQVNRNYVGMLEREEYAASIDMLEKLALARHRPDRVSARRYLITRRHHRPPAKKKIVLDTAMPAAGTKASSCRLFIASAA